MAVRNVLHRSKLEDLKKWLGERALPPKGEWEVLRWRGEPGQPMRIIFDNAKSPEHLSCNDAAYPDVCKFINSKNETKKKYDLSMLREIICNAHMEGQRNAGCAHPSWGNACRHLSTIPEETILSAIKEITWHTHQK